MASDSRPIADPVDGVQCSEVLDVRALVTVAEITTSVRRIGAEVELGHGDLGLDEERVVNCDGLHTVAQTTLTTRLGMVDCMTLSRVCAAVSYALGC